MFDKNQIPTTIDKELNDKVVDSLVDTDKMMGFSKQQDEELDKFCDCRQGTSAREKWRNEKMIHL